MSPKLSKLAKYLENNYQDVAFLGARSLAGKAGVSEATVTRLAYACGFSGYGQFQSTIKDEFQKKLSLRKHLPSEEKNLLSEVLSMEREIMNDMERQIDQVGFVDAVEMMYQASRVLVVGTHANAMMAEYMAYFWNPAKKDVILIRELNNQSFNCCRSLPAAVMALTNAPVTGLMVRDKDDYKENISQYSEFLTGKDLFQEKEIGILGLNAPLVNFNSKPKKHKRITEG